MPAMTDMEKIQLVLETVGVTDIKAAEAAYDKLEKQIRNVEKATKDLEVQTSEYEVQERRVATAEDEAVAAAVRETQARKALSQILEEKAIPAQKELETHISNTASAHGDMGRGVLQTSYAVQDFTSVLTGGGGLSRAGLGPEQHPGAFDRARCGGWFGRYDQPGLGGPGRGHPASR